MADVLLQLVTYIVVSAYMLGNFYHEVTDLQTCKLQMSFLQLGVI